VCIYVSVCNVLMHVGGCVWYLRSVQPFGFMCGGVSYDLQSLVALFLIFRGLHRYRRDMYQVKTIHTYHL